MAGYLPPGGGGGPEYGGGGIGGGGYGGGDGPRRPIEYFPYFLDGEGIERSVVHHDLPRYIGNNARSKPGDREGIQGFWYGGGRMLTEAQVKSLKADSAKFRAEEENAHRYPNPRRIDYEHSDALRESHTHNYDGSNPDRRFLSERDQMPFHDERGRERRQPEKLYRAFPEERGNDKPYPGSYPEQGLPRELPRDPGGREITYAQLPGPVPPPPPAWHQENFVPRAPEPHPELPDPRYLYMPHPDNRPWFDTHRGVYLPPFSPPDPAVG